MAQQIDPKQVKGLENIIEKLDSLIGIKHIGTGLRLEDDGTLVVVGDGRGSATVQYVDQQDGLLQDAIDDVKDSYLPLTGGSVAGLNVGGSTGDAVYTSGGGVFLQSESAGTVGIKVGDNTVLSATDSLILLARNLNMGNNVLTGLTTPVNDSDATSKEYVDNLVSDNTPNDGILTVTNNGATVETFSANSSADKTVALAIPSITVTSTDPGEGSPLSANHFIAVYEV